VLTNKHTDVFVCTREPDLDCVGDKQTHRCVVHARHTGGVDLL